MESEEESLKCLTENEPNSPLIEKYEIVEHSPKMRFSRFNEQIGSGASKVVYKAVDNYTGCEVAWNVVKTCNLTRSEKQRIRDEIMIIQRLQHQNIIHLIRAWHNKQKEEIVFITEIMTGGSLRNYLKKIRKPYLRVIKHWCLGILRGLHYLHSQKPYPIIHRDLKCDNIFVSSSTGDVRIGDLGLSVFMTSSYKASCLGTPAYMAPELFEEKYGPSVDIYAFGMCVLEMCTQEMPYSECSKATEIYRKVMTGVKPEALERIHDEELKSFIELCITPVDQRPLTEELLSHSFLEVDDSDERVHRPPKVKNGVPKLLDLKSEPTQQGLIRTYISIGFKDPVSKVVTKARYDFEFDLSRDCSYEVASELIMQLGLEVKHLPVLAETMQERIDEILNEKEEGSISCNSTAITHKLTPFSSGNRSPLDSCQPTLPDEVESNVIEALCHWEFPGVLNKETCDIVAIAKLQEALEHALGVKINERGYYGLKTEIMVKKFEEQLGLNPTGEVNYEIWEKLFNSQSLANPKKVFLRHLSF